MLQHIKQEQWDVRFSKWLKFPMLRLEETTSLAFAAMSSLTVCLRMCGIGVGTGTTLRKHVHSSRIYMHPLLAMI